MRRPFGEGSDAEATRSLYDARQHRWFSVSLSVVRYLGADARHTTTTGAEGTVTLLRRGPDTAGLCSRRRASCSLSAGSGGQLDGSQSRACRVGCCRGDRGSRAYGRRALGRSRADRPGRDVDPVAADAADHAKGRSIQQSAMRAQQLRGDLVDRSRLGGWVARPERFVVRAHVRGPTSPPEHLGTDAA